MTKTAVVVTLTDKRKFKVYLEIGKPVSSSWGFNRTSTMDDAITELAHRGGVKIGKHFVPWHNVFSIGPLEEDNEPGAGVAGKTNGKCKTKR